MFTTDNTVGYTTEQLDAANAEYYRWHNNEVAKPGWVNDSDWGQRVANACEAILRAVEDL